MEPDGRDERRGGARPTLQPLAETAGKEGGDRLRDEVVFDFTGRRELGLADLAVVITARLQAGPQGRVWVKEIPFEVWNVLRSMRLDHLFLVVPSPGDCPN